MHDHRSSEYDDGWSHAWSEPQPWGGYNIHTLSEVAPDAEVHADPRPSGATLLATMMLRRRVASLIPALTPTRISIGLDRLRSGVAHRTRAQGMSIHHPQTAMLAELGDVVAAMPATMGALGRWAWPPTPEVRDRVMWNSDQAELREARLANEIAAASTSSEEPLRDFFYLTAHTDACFESFSDGTHHRSRGAYIIQRPSSPAQQVIAARQFTDSSEPELAETGDPPVGDRADIHATMHLTHTWPRSTAPNGVAGVFYPPLPATSNYCDPGHPTSAASTLPAWMFDTGAGIAGFRDRYGLSPTFQLDRPVTVGGIVSSNNLTVTTGAMLDNLRVLHDSRFSANCLPSSAIVDAGWKVRYDGLSDSYQVVTASQCKLGFHRYVMRNGAITKHYLCHPSMAYVAPTELSKSREGGSGPVVIAATTVQGNLAMQTPQDAKAATLAHKFLTNMGGSLAHGLVRLPMLRGVNITADSVRKAAAIFGPVRSHVQGSATSVQDVAIVNELPAERAKPTPQSLAVDLCSVMGMWFVVGIFLPCHFLTVSHVTSHASPVIFSAIRTMVFAALKRNFDVLQIQADGERGIHSGLLEEFCANRKIATVKVGAGQHEAHAERITRSLKAEIRNIAARVVPASLPHDLALQLVIAAVTSLNCRLTTALVGDRSPHQIWFAAEHIHAQDHQYAFGDLAMAKTPNQKNDIAPRADTVMVLYPVFNGLHGYLVYKFGTGMLVVRNHNTLQELAWGRADKARIERLADDDPDGKDMPRKDGRTASSACRSPTQRSRKHSSQCRPSTTRTPPRRQPWGNRGANPTRGP